MINLLHGDCLEQMKTLDDNSVDSIVSDPPYGISFMAKKWDYDVPSVEVWEEAMRVLKPGGHALIACGTRTQHRMVVNIEDAGFEIRDVVSWIYGSGFPKSLNISKAIDKSAGAEREVVEWKKSGGGRTTAANPMDRDAGKTNSHDPITAPATEAAKQWDGWGSAIKPAVEFFTLCRKPLSEKTIAANVLRWNTGGLNIDKCRVVADNDLHEKPISRKKEDRANNTKDVPNMQHGISGVEQLSEKAKEGADMRGKVPSCVNEEGEQSALEGGNNGKARRLHTEQLDWQDGASGGNGAASREATGKERSCPPQEPQEGGQQDRKLRGDQQGASHNEISQHSMQSDGQAPVGRFPANLIHDGSQEVLELFPETKGDSKNRKPRGNNVGGDKFKTTKAFTTTGHSDNGSAARFFYVPKASKKDRNEGCDELENGNNHATVKPTALMAYLCRLITPPNGVVLDPYMGSGSTGKAAIREGFSFVGCELDKDYYNIAKARVGNP